MRYRELTLEEAQTLWELGYYQFEYKAVPHGGWCEWGPEPGNPSEMSEGFRGAVYRIGVPCNSEGVL